MEARRKNEVYVTLLIDLVNLDVVTKEQAESLLGYKLPAHVLTSSTPVEPVEPVDDDTDDDTDTNGE